MADQQQAKIAASPICRNHHSVFKEKRSRKSSRKDEAMFHDFLGSKTAATDSSVILPQKIADASPSVSVSHGGGSSGGGRTPLSSTSDLVSSERTRGHHLEGIPFQGGRNKRSNSDSVFTVSTKDGAPRMGHETLESFQMKMFKSGGGGERHKKSYEDDGFYTMQAMRPASGTLIVHPNVSKWEKPISMGVPCAQYPRVNQFTPFPNQAPNRLRDCNPSSSVVSHTAADEGSRTGMKGPGTLSITAWEPPSKIKMAEPDCFPSSSRGISTSSRQMTIFYGGQAHVFDDVHPNKADVIMGLASSNGGSWSTTYSPKLGGSIGEGSVSGGEYDGGSTALLNPNPRGR